MKLTRHPLQTIAAGAALCALSFSPAAFADVPASTFSSYHSAPRAQYGTPGPGHKKHKKHKKKHNSGGNKGTNGNGNGNKGANGNGNGSNPSGDGLPVAAVNGTGLISPKTGLPFTGTDLTPIVLIALLLLSAGLFLAVGERTLRRRRGGLGA